MLEQSIYMTVVTGKPDELIEILNSKVLVIIYYFNFVVIIKDYDH